MPANEIRSTALNKCARIEGNLGLRSGSSEARLFSHIGVLLTNDLRFVYELSTQPVRKDHMTCTRLKHLMYFVEPCAEEVRREGGVLLIVPSVLASAWRSFLNSSENDGGVRAAWTSKELDKALLAQSEVLILSDNLLPAARTTLANRRYNKVILCNASNTRVVEIFKSDFYWFVHPSPSQAPILAHVPSHWHHAITVELLPPSSDIPVEEIFSETPIENITLEGLVDEVVMSHLNSNDITRALQCISHKNLRSHRDVARHVLRNFTGSIGQLDAKIYTVEKMEYVCSEEKTKRMQALQSMRVRLQTRQDELARRLESTDENCFICFQSAINTCMTKCCSKRCCFECIHKWFSHSRRCPMCNTPSTDVFVLKEPQFEQREATVSNRSTDIAPNKFENLFMLLRRLREEDAKHVLICTSNTDQLRQISDVVDKCTIRKLIVKRNFRMEKLRPGFCVIIQNIEKFPYPVLLSQPLSNIIFFDDRTYDLREVFVREHALESTRLWRLRYVTQSGISVQTRNV
jgi:hypothetical protein